MPRVAALPWSSLCLGLAALGAVALCAVGPAGAGPTPVATTEQARVELGRRLFFDPLASRSGERSCSSCHDPLHGFSDPAVKSPDDVGRTKRHSQTILDSHLNPTAHWDGEFDTIEELVLARLDRVNGVKGVGPAGPFASLGAGGGPRDGGGGGGGGGYGRQPSTPSEPADPRPEADEPQDPDPAAPKAPEGEAADDAAHDGDRSGTGNAEGARRRRQAGRREDAVHVLPLDLTRLPHVADVIEHSGRYAEAFTAAFGSAQVNSARIAEAIATYCRSIRSTQAPIDRHLAGDQAALSASARRGLALFRGRAGCVQCHRMDGQHPTFTDYRFHNTGIAFKAARRGAPPSGEPLDVDERSQADLGRSVITTQSPDRRAFKTATLRDLTRRGPYMHDGAFETLADVVRHYAAGGAREDDRQDERLRGFAASDEDVQDLVAFLASLTGEEPPGLVTRAWEQRASTTRVRLVDGKGKPLAGLTFDLVEEGDRMPAWEEAHRASRTVTTDPDGWIEFQPGPTTHTRLALPDSLPATGGLLVPDTCARAVVEVPVDGRVSLVVTYGAGFKPVERLVAEHEGTMRLPGHLPPRTYLNQVGSLALEGRTVVSYEGWRRTDVPADVILRIPGDRRPDPEHRVRLVGGKALRLDVGE